MRVWSSGSGDTPLPMDVGQVASLSKGGGKKGDEGKGKKGQSKDKGKGSSSAPTQFDGYCNGCGKWGHRKADCWSTATTGKGEKGKDSGKKK